MLCSNFHISLDSQMDGDSNSNVTADQYLQAAMAESTSGNEPHLLITSIKYPLSRCNNSDETQLFFSRKASL